MVRAKFKVNKIERSETTVVVGQTAEGKDIYGPGEIQTVCMHPVYGNNNPEHENTKFWKASPSGEIKLGCINLDAAKYFELGKEYYIDFTAAE